MKRGRGKGLAAVQTVLLAAGCGRGPAPEPAAAQHPSHPPASAPQPAEASRAPPHQEDPDATRRVAEALAWIAGLRELAPMRAVRGVTLSRSEMAERVRAQIAQDVPAEVVAGESELLVALGLVPVDFDYVESVVGLMGSQLAGFYDPEEETMYLAEDLSGAEEQATLSHELAHALQDQHYDLDDLVRYRPDASDATGAVHALAEGDATSAMMDELLGQRGMKAVDLPDDLVGVQVRGAMELSTGTQAFPGVLRRSVIAPYVDGLVLVHWLRRRGGWGLVDEIWRRPPATTEQVLHPEKLLAREPGVSVPEPLAPAGGPPSLVHHDILGEQSLRIVLEEWVPRQSAAAAASDWAGDRLGVFGDEKRRAVAWHLRYDFPAAARRGFEALARGVLGGGVSLRDGAQASAAKAPGPAEAKARARAAARVGSVCVQRRDLGPLAVAVRRTDVAVTAGPYARASGDVRPAGDCSGGVAWAKAVSAQR